MHVRRPGSSVISGATSDERMPSPPGDGAGGAVTARSIAEIAATLPGATRVFRHFHFDFCCMLDQPLDVVAAWHETPLEEVQAALAALPRVEPRSAPRSIEPLIGHILARYHAQHRVELPPLARLAETVETRHRGHPDLPIGLAGVLAELTDALDEQMRFEEMHLFPRLRHESDGLENAFIALCERHNALEDYLCCLETVTAGQQPPDDACRRWRQLFAGTERLVDDLIRHRHLETATLADLWRDRAPRGPMH